MIVFDLSCDQGHVFEIWFGSSADYEDQRKRSLISCPYCNSTAVDKYVMAPRVAAKGNQASPTQEATPAAEAPSAEQVKAVMKAMAEAQEKTLKDSDYVGVRFVEEARAMHYGETTHRPIHGEASVNDAKALAEEGVPVAPLPFPIRTPSRDN